jgi:endo-1,4-beta-xylanase
MKHRNLLYKRNLFPMRILKLLCASALLAVMTTQTPVNAADEKAKDAATLRQAAGDRLLIGAAIMSNHLDDPKLAKLIAEQFNSLTGENEFKPDQLQRERGKFTFEQADKIAEFAQKHDMKLIGHTLLWHNQAPAWMFMDENNQPLPRDKALANLKDHIDGVVKHFKGKVIGWDVVNEAISDSPNEYLRDTPARKAIGDDYLVKAFEFAKAADPDVQLYYNDYSIEGPGKREKTLRLIKELKAAGAQVDAVGIQGHFLLDQPAVKVVDDAIAAFKKLGVKVMITELDVDVLPRGQGADVAARQQGSADPYPSGLPPEVQKKLASRYRELFGVFEKHKDAVTRVTFWGTHDGTSWLNNWPQRGRTNHALLWDRELQPKPAFKAVTQVLAD